MKRPIVTLTTDFGHRDPYVAQMKGVLLNGVAGSDVRLIDVTHTIPPQDVVRAAFALDEVVDAFPAETIHLVVVDPGVGTERAIVAVETAAGRFVGPDNGLFGPVTERHSPTLIVECTDPKWWRTDVSSTFHGRDIMAPLAAHWVNGIDPRRFGDVRESIQPLDVPTRATIVDGRIEGRVLWADHFGNLVTNVRMGQIEQLSEASKSPLVVGIGVTDVGPLRRTYAQAEPAGWVAHPGSSGRLEIAINGGNAAQRLGWTREADIPVIVTNPTSPDR